MYATLYTEILYPPICSNRLSFKSHLGLYHPFCLHSCTKFDPTSQFHTSQIFSSSSWPSNRLVLARTLFSQLCSLFLILFTTSTTESRVAVDETIPITTHKQCTTIKHHMNTRGLTKYVHLSRYSPLTLCSEGVLLTPRWNTIAPRPCACVRSTFRRMMQDIMPKIEVEKKLESGGGVWFLWCGGSESPPHQNGSGNVVIHNGVQWCAPLHKDFLASSTGDNVSPDNYTVGVTDTQGAKMGLTNTTTFKILARFFVWTVYNISSLVNPLRNSDNTVLRWLFNFSSFYENQENARIRCKENF